jgi:hypothetical protein
MMVAHFSLEPILFYEKEKGDAFFFVKKSPRYENAGHELSGVVKYL